MKQQPPRLAKNLLRRFCHVSFIEEVEGDLDEQFSENLKEKGLLRARVLYWSDVLHAIASGNRQAKDEPSSQISMTDSFGHFFKIFFRSLRHSQSSAIINTTGLVLSLVSFIAIWLYVSDELSYNEYHPDAGKIYRTSLSFKRYGDGVTEIDARVPGLWIGEVREQRPEIKSSTRFSKFGLPGAVKYEKKELLFEEPNFFWVDTTYTDIFKLEITRGSEPVVVFRDPSKVIITESIAQKYFADEDPIGKEIVYSHGGMDFPFVVASVMKDYPSNVHFHPAFIASNQALNPFWMRNGTDRVNSTGDPFTYSFFKVDNETDVPAILAAMRPIVKKHSNETVEPVFTKLTEIHFTQGMMVELEPAGDKSYIYISASIGILIIVIAAINYMNLATARSVRRAKEVGLRKTLGVKRSSLINQFLGESMMMISISFAIALSLTVVVLPFFNQLTGKSFTYLSLFTGNTLIILVAVIGVLALLSGSYPAFYLSRFKPIDVLKGAVSTSSGGENFRKTLVVFQFTITMALIICAGVIRSQLSLIHEGKLASNTGRVITIRNVAVKNFHESSEFRSLVMKNKNVEEISLSDHLPRRDGFSFITVPLSIRSKGPDEYMWNAVKVDDHFAGMFKLEFLAGRNFSSAIALDTTNVILNESAVRALNMTPEEVLGQEISANKSFMEDNGYGFGKVIGVVKDFPYESVRFQVQPLCLYGYYPAAETINIKLSGIDLQETIASIESVWKKIHPSRPFEYWFMDDEFGKLYKQEIQMAKLSNYFTAFAIVIACLGLFGLATFTAEQKTKEIGIRKVLGASVGQVLLLLTGRFVTLVLIASVVAMPLAFFAMKSWLEGFAYRAQMEWWVFAGAGGVILVLTYLTVGIESIRAAVANPVDSLKHE
ncbi:MAG: FtsX-like permease family protein [Bacteroidota bacterium]